MNYTDEFEEVEMEETAAVPAAVTPESVRTELRSMMDRLKSHEECIALACLLADEGVRIRSVWVGNEFSGWYATDFSYKGFPFRLHPKSGPDGCGPWFIEVNRFATSATKPPRPE